MKNGRDLSIVILTRNGGEIFSRSLAALSVCAGAEQAEILVIDSGSSDDTLLTVARYPRIRLHSIPQASFNHGATRNLGVRLTSRETVVFLVQDAIPVGGDFLQLLGKPLQDEKVGAVFGRQVAYPNATFAEKHCQHFTYPEQGCRRSTTGKGRLSDIFFSNVCSAIRRELLVEHPFPEGCLMSEDQIWARTILENGHEIVYEPAARVVHSHHYDYPTLFRRYFDSGASLQGVTCESFTDLLAYQAKYLSTGAKKAGKLTDFASLLIFEGVRAAGILAGKNYRRLPRKLIRQLSLHASFWDYCRAPAADPAAAIA